MAKLGLVQVLVCEQAAFHVTIVPAAVLINWECDDGDSRLRSSGM